MGFEITKSPEGRADLPRPSSSASRRSCNEARRSAVYIRTGSVEPRDTAVRVDSRLSYRKLLRWESSRWSQRKCRSRTAFFLLRRYRKREKIARIKTKDCHSACRGCMFFLFLFNSERCLIFARFAHWLTFLSSQLLLRSPSLLLFSATLVTGNRRRVLQHLRFLGDDRRGDFRRDACQVWRHVSLLLLPQFLPLSFLDVGKEIFSKRISADWSLAFLLNFIESLF